jgi:Flp pilus assembly protein TadG
MKQHRQTSRYKRQGGRAGYVLLLVALLLPLLIGLIGLTVDGGLLLASHERAQSVADATARSVAIALKRGAPHDSLQAYGESVAYGLNGLPRDDEMTSSSQVAVHHPPVSGPFTGNSAYVEVLVSHPLDTHFIQIAGTGTSHFSSTARAVAGYRSIPRNAGVVVLDPLGNPGLSVSGSNAKLTVDSAIIVYSNRAGENEYGATVGLISSGQAAVTLGGSGTTLQAVELYVAGGVDDAANYLAPAVEELYAGMNDPVDDPFHDHTTTLLPIPTTNTGVINRQMGGVTISTGTPRNLVSPNNYDSATGVTTLYPGIYDSISITGGNVVLKEGIYVLRNTNGGGNVLTITGGNVVARGVMIYNTGSTWDPVTGGSDQSDLSVPSNTPPSGAQQTRFGGVTMNGALVTMTPIDINNPAYDYSEAPGIGVFQDMVYYQRRFNTQAINVNDGASFPGGISGRIYAKWAELKISGNGTYNFSIVVGSLSSSGNATITVRDRLPLEPRVSPVRLVE